MGDNREAAAAPSATTLAVVHMLMGPFIGSILASLGLWLLMLFIIPPVAMYLMLGVATLPCGVVLLTAIAARDLDRLPTLVIVAAAGAAASYAQASFLHLGDMSHPYPVLMALAGAASAAACDVIARRRMNHMRIAAWTWVGVIGWSLAWFLQIASGSFRLFG